MNTTKSISRHFFFTTIHEAVRRTYGGTNYTLAVWENKGKGKFVKIGEVSRCTAAHKGKVSEAFGVVWESLSAREQRRLLKLPVIAKENAGGGGSFPSYFSWSLGDAIGWKVQEI